ncbi:symmetrical bis(5'-nucleosyl)-tetraphosphatase [Rhodoferax sp. AJA081-3]|uniref:symmetrical bis(5'-nucleosyl)-tetraphosphatase n=1 Tax=Rhodoferax sp. AJA081-3 TaxID=2752316 RepID=UPI001ADFC401|nr:symmetrical bis(5'-nucleosyl)-tetraphosphatase [Rhodoferax sp. AJA081-3]QTN29843.1 symmetrical bis(5'-nucleosyl)-tetraphosphatase [Rhodoferax sp. AJA081-3]
MALYLIGDVQGCDAALQDLLDTLDYSPSRDTLYVLGDLVNRGPDSAGVLRRLMGYSNAAQCLLGNHDLNLLAVAQGLRKPHRKDTLDAVLGAEDRHAMLHWLRHQKMAMLLNRGGVPLLMVHAGVLPTWSADQTMALAHEVETALQGGHAAEFLKSMYGNTPSQWSESLTGMDRLRVIVNALTRLRFCTAEGAMEFDSKGRCRGAPQGYMPWFEVPNRQTAQISVAFGHWSTLGWLDRHDVLSLDTGCVWGGSLSALRFNLQDQTQELIQVQCAVSQHHGEH